MASVEETGAAGAELCDPNISWKRLVRITFDAGNYYRELGMSYSEAERLTMVFAERFSYLLDVPLARQGSVFFYCRTDNCTRRFRRAKLYRRHWNRVHRRAGVTS